MLIRGWSAVVFSSLALLICEVVQRLVIVPLVWIMPSRRVPVLSAWIKIMAWVVTRPVGFLGGAVIPRPPQIVPAKPGVLILMNHQSVFDIPLVVQTVEAGYPRIVTRVRYTRWIPVISHMIRLYQYPVVDPSANTEAIRRSLDDLTRAATDTHLPLVVFPEGTRTKDGQIGHFKKGGLSRILAARPWTVYVFVADGFWRAAKFKDFVRSLSLVEGKMEHVGTLEWTDPTADSASFIDGVHGMMQEHLAVMRAESTSV